MTFSVSVSAETKARLKKAAERLHGGNVSALIESIVTEAERREAADWLLSRSPPVDEAAYAEFMAEMTGVQPKRSRRRGRSAA